jgi:hypothetical protein
MVSVLDQDHRPAVLLRVGKAGEAVDNAGTRDREASAGAPREIAGGLRGVGGRLLVAHADIGDPGLLRGSGDRLHGKADDPEHVLDALLFETPRHQSGAVDFAHAFLRCGGSRRRTREMPSGPALEEPFAQKTTHFSR